MTLLLSFFKWVVGKLPLEAGLHWPFQMLHPLPHTLHETEYKPHPYPQPWHYSPLFTHPILFWSDFTFSIKMFSLPHLILLHSLWKSNGSNLERIKNPSRLRNFTNEKASYGFGHCTLVVLPCTLHLSQFSCNSRQGLFLVLSDQSGKRLSNFSMFTSWCWTLAVDMNKLLLCVM